MTKETLYTFWKAHDAAAAYVVGFPFRGNVYRVTVREIPLSWVQLNRTSSRKRAVPALRLRIHAAERAELVAQGAELVGPESLLNDDQLNRGEVWEKLITEAAGQSWAKDSTPYWVAGDLRLEGVEVQIKYNNATLTTAHALELA